MSRVGLRFSYFVIAFRNCLLNINWLSISDSQRYHLNLHLINKVEDVGFLPGKLFNFLHCICSKKSASYCCKETTIKITFFSARSHWYLIYFWLDKVLKDTDVNRHSIFSNGRSLKITSTAILSSQPGKNFQIKKRFSDKILQNDENILFF